MKINFGMWKKASWELIKMDDKAEWDALDVFSKWLIATRSAVTTVTIYSSIIAGLLAWKDGTFNFLPWLIITIGLFVAHGTNNLLNDYTDFTRGVDADNYFRTQYGVHPLVQGFWNTKQQINWFLVSGFIATICGFYAVWYTFTTHPEALGNVIALFVFGAIILLFYTWPMKYFAVGEFTIFLIWGPIMVSAVYLVLSGTMSWMIALAGIPWGLTVASINYAKHTDKMKPDKAKGVGTFPVRVGEPFARATTIFTLVAAYGVIIYLVATQFLSPVLLLVLFALKRALFAVVILSKPRPDEPPAGFEAFWPTYLSGVCFYHNRMFGGLLILGFLLDAAFSKLPAGSVSPMAASLIVLGVAALVAVYNTVRAKK